MSNDIQIFSSEKFGDIRVVNVENEPWFVASDVAKALGFRNAPNMTRILDDDEKGYSEVSTPGGTQRASIITEAGLYQAIFASRAKSVHEFKRYVTHDILPAIRRDGAYVYSNGTEDDATLMARALIAANRTIERNKRELDELRPKARFADAVETSHTSILVGDFAKILRQNGVEIGQNRLFQWLRDNGYLMKQGSSKNMPTQKSMDLKLFEVKERAIDNPDGSVRITRTTKMTGKGQVYFLSKFIA